MAAAAQPPAAAAAVAAAPLLPSLAEAPRGLAWRARGPDELDAVELLGEGGRGARVRLRSLGKHPTVAQSPAKITFQNTSAVPVRILWVDWQGNEIPYTTLQPAQSSRYSTFGDHIWLARDLESGRRMCIDGAQAVAAHTDEGHTAAISQPPVLQWSTADHAAFPRPCREQAATLLRCWRRLSGGGAASGSSGSAASLGSLPIELVHLIIERAAPTNVWQEACAAGSGGIAPMQLRRAAAFDRLAAEACAAAGGRLPPRSRLPADSLVPLIEQAPAGLPGSMHAVGTALAVVAIGALAIQH